MSRCATLASLTALLLNVACTSTSGDTVATVPVQAKEDPAYAPILERWHQEQSVVSQFQKRLDIHAVFFTDEFRRAYTARFERLRGETKSHLDEGFSNKLVVLASVYSPEHSYEALDDRRFWTISLEFGPNALPLFAARSVQEKALLTPFFPFVNPWSRDYLLAFDPESEGGLTALPQEVTLVLRSALVNVRFPWRQAAVAK